MPICIYHPMADDFTGNGLGLLTPIECTVKEEAAGMYEMEMVHPIDGTLRWYQIVPGCIIKAPVPVRESPLYEAPAMTDPVLVSRQAWKVTGSGSGRYIRTGPGTKYKRIATCAKEEEVIELEDAENPWKLICRVNGGQVGYMSTKYLQTSRIVDEIIEPAKPIAGSVLKLGQSRDQLFRVYSVETDSENATITIKAMHVFYDDAGNLINAEYMPDKVDVEEAMARIRNDMHQAPEVHFRALNLNGKIGGDYSFKSPIEAYLDPDEGIIAQTGAMLVRDNWEAFLIPSMERDRGVTVRRGKNLLGVKVTNDISDVVTRIIPIGKDKDDNPIGIAEPGYIDSPHINDYPFPRIKRVEYDVQVDDENFRNDDEVRNEIRRLAEEEFSINGVDLPTYGMEVDFVLLGNTEEYKNYASLQAVHLYDTVTVIDEMIGLRAKVRVTAYEWDCIAEQYISVTLGQLQDMEQTVYSFDLPTGGVSGIKIANNSLAGTALRNATIEYAKIANATIKRLSADAITALTARIDEIVANEITTDKLYAAFAEMIALKVGTITAGNIETDQLAAALAKFVSLHAATGDFDFATIKNLVADALVLKQGVAESVTISNLFVTSANLLSAVIGDLIIKGEDGVYYRIAIGSDGLVQTQPVELSAGEIAAGETAQGNQIIESHINAADINAQNIRAISAIISTIITDALTAGKITAGEAMIASATIPTLYTTAIQAIGNNMDLSANDTIRMLLGANEEAQKWFTFDDERGLIIQKPGYTDADGNEHAASIYSTVTDETGFHIKRSDMAEYIATFARDRLKANAVQIGDIVCKAASVGGWVWCSAE